MPLVSDATARLIQDAVTADLAYAEASRLLRSVPRRAAFAALIRILRLAERRCMALAERSIPFAARRDYPGFIRINRRWNRWYRLRKRIEAALLETSEGCDALTASSPLP